MSSPAAVKTRNGDLKYVLKKAVRGVIPDEIIDRKKQGFGVPVYDWFFGRLGDEIDRELRSFCQQTDFLDWRGVQQLKEQGQGPLLWVLLNFALWWKSSITEEAPILKAAS
jgi:asparagine synthase (glutamine-hydrolysing)